MSTSTARRSRMVASTSSFVSPIPRMMPDFVGMWGAFALACVKIFITRS